MACTDVPEHLLNLLGPKQAYVYDESVKHSIVVSLKHVVDKETVGSLVSVAHELELESLEADEDHDSGKLISNMGGFHSAQNLFSSSKAPLVALKEAVYKLIAAACPTCKILAAPEAWVTQ